MLYPMFAMVVLTLVIGLVALRIRFASVKRGEVSVRYFKLMQGDKVPEAVLKSTRCFNNLFEVPVLFYVACTLYISMAIDSMAALVLAWVFVTCRAVQAWVHMTYNHILHRMIAFWLACLSALALWLNLVIIQLQQS